MKTIASEGMHWYRKDGTPQYTIIGANGNTRPTTLRDARKHGFVPSVTMIIGQVAKHGLDVWKQKQVLYSSLTLPRIEGENDDALVARILVDSKEHAKQAREKGTEIHKWLELAYQGEDVPEEFAMYTSSTMASVSWLTGKQNWKTEKTIASNLGYGGKVDLMSPEWTIDFKTKEFDEDAQVKNFVYPEMAMQLAAYDNDFGSRCANVFVSITNPGLVKIYEWDAEEIKRAYKKFITLLKFWKLDKNIKEEI